MRLVDQLRRNAELFPDKTAVICGAEQCSYAQLWQLIEQRAQSLDTTNQLIALRSQSGIEFIADYFAIHLAGCVCVPLDKDMPDDMFRDFQTRLAAMRVPDGSADVLFTTGTTGKSKGVVISHRTILANGDNLVHGQQFAHDLTFVINGPLNHIGSLSKLYPSFLVGATVHIVDGMKDVNAFFDAIDNAPWKAATFLVPASIRMLIRFSKERMAESASKIDFIETGAAPIAQSDMEELCRLLPDSRLYNTYASTETGIIATYDYNHNECIEGCLGRPMPHSTLSIDKDGHVVCMGDTLMTEYIGDPELTATILHDDKIVTADLGCIDERGCLRLKGRDGDVINVGGFKVSPVEVESAAMSMPCIKDCICIVAPHPVIGNVLKLIYVSDTEPKKRDIALYLKSKLEPHKVPFYYEQTTHIERTFNGKLNRKHYQ